MMPTTTRQNYRSHSRFRIVQKRIPVVSDKSLTDINILLERIAKLSAMVDKLSAMVDKIEPIAERVEIHEQALKTHKDSLVIIDARMLGHEQSLRRLHRRYRVTNVLGEPRRT